MLRTSLSSSANAGKPLKKRGFADIIFERKKSVIRIKDYELKDISISQINQLNKYLKDCNFNLGFSVSYKKPPKDNFLIGKNKIFILEKSELNKIPVLMKGLSDNGLVRAAPEFTKKPLSGGSIPSCPMSYNKKPLDEIATPQNPFKKILVRIKFFQFRNVYK